MATNSQSEAANGTYQEDRNQFEEAFGRQEVRLQDATGVTRADLAEGGWRLGRFQR